MRKRGKRNTLLGEGNGTGNEYKTREGRITRLWEHSGRVEGGVSETAI